MKPANSYTASEAMRVHCTVTGDHVIKVKGYAYTWDKQAKLFLLNVPKPVILVSKQVTKKIRSRIAEDDYKNLTIGRNETSLDRLAKLVNPLSKALHQKQSIKDYFKNKLGE